MRLSDVTGKRPPELILLDCDGTLVDSQQAIVRAMEAAFLEDGRDAPTAEAVRAVVGLSLENAIGQLWQGATPKDRTRLAAGYRTAFRQPQADGAHRAGPLFPGVAEGLGALRQQGVTLGIVTGKSREGMAVVFEDHDVRDFFAVVETGDLHPSKPDPAMVLSAVRTMESDPARTIVVGDTTYDMQMARRAGVRAVGVAWGNHDRGALHHAGAEIVLDEFRDVVALAANGADVRT